MDSNKVKNFTNIAIIICVIFLIGFCLYTFVFQKEDLKEKKKTYQMDESLTSYVGNWVADGTQAKIQTGVDAKGNPTYDDDYTKPYQLLLKSDGSYYIKFNNKTGEESGSYKKSNDEVVFSPDSSKRPIWYCKIKDEKELINCMYATSFKKID